jgi:Zn-dependent peptidase ImmA (M78 family)/DNA-binding XRE family transcriptional regulator
MTFNHRMIALAREAAGMTQAALAHAVGVSQALLSKYESGLEQPSEATLAAVAKECDVPIEFFYQPDMPVGEGLVDLFHRKRATLPAKPLKRAFANVNVARLEILRLLRNVELTDVAPFPEYPPSEYGSPEDIALRVRQLWRVPPGPLPDLTALIEATGTPVLKMGFGHEKLFAISVPGPPGRYLIVLNDRLPPSNQRMTLAHEIGHLVMHQHATGREDIEDEAFLFASTLLMPASDIRSHLRNVRFRDLGGLKPIWRVSLAALIRRAHDLGEITPRQYRTFNMQLNKLPGGRKHEPGEFDAEEPRLIRSVVTHHLEDLGYSQAEIARLLVATEESMRERYLGEPRRTLRPVGREGVISFPVPKSG